MKQDTKDNLYVAMFFAGMILVGGAIVLAVIQSAEEMRAVVQECSDTAINRCAELECKSTYDKGMSSFKNFSETKELAQCRARGEP